jgi:glutathione S-transferase
MKIYDAMTPNTLRVQVFLAEKGVEVPREKIDVMGGGTRTPEFLAKNSLGELPLLELDDGSFVAESVAICRYFEALHPEPSLMGGSPREQAHIEMWNRRMEHHIFAPVGEFGRHTIPFFADKVEQVPDYAATQLRRFDKNWAWLDGELADGRPYIAGQEFTVADITGMAALFVCNIIEKELPGEFENAKRWGEAVRARPSFAAQFAEAA